ncbi:hypothetical protein LMG28138_05072 [Pararobbsia alpina]|uniref:Uncharacterized protein n=1 Tax=Pararobbsia alpina TaxID=621374 RepID=A0A6S7BKD2_9BURK|nr:hypothetical protein LMG28138_05072 [Pararobbsia alpina]
MKNLNARAWLALAILTVVMGLLLFVPAGTLHYWEAWAYLLIFTGASALITLYLTLCWLTLAKLLPMLERDQPDKFPKSSSPGGLPKFLVELESILPRGLRRRRTCKSNNRIGSSLHQPQETPVH